MACYVCTCENDVVSELASITLRVVLSMKIYCLGLIFLVLCGVGCDTGGRSSDHAAGTPSHHGRRGTKSAKEPAAELEQPDGADHSGQSEVLQQKKSKWLTKSAMPLVETALNNAVEEIENKEKKTHVAKYHAARNVVFELKDESTKRVVFKMALEEDKRDEYADVALANTQRARQVVAANPELKHIIIPSVHVFETKIGKIVAEEKFDVPLTPDMAREQYESYYERFEAEPKLETQFRRLFLALTVFLEKTGLSDVKFDNFPLWIEPDGTLYIVVIDKDRGSGKGVLELFSGGEIEADLKVAMPPDIFFDSIRAKVKKIEGAMPLGISDQEFSALKERRRKQLENSSGYRRWLREKGLYPALSKVKSPCLIDPGKFASDPADKSFLEELRKAYDNVLNSISIEGSSVYLRGNWVKLGTKLQAPYMAKPKKKTLFGKAPKVVPLTPQQMCNKIEPVLKKMRDREKQIFGFECSTAGLFIQG